MRLSDPAAPEKGRSRRAYPAMPPRGAEDLCLLGTRRREAVPVSYDGLPAATPERRARPRPRPRGPAPRTRRLARPSPGAPSRHRVPRPRGPPHILKYMAPKWGPWSFWSFWKPTTPLSPLLVDRKGFCRSYSSLRQPASHSSLSSISSFLFRGTGNLLETVYETISKRSRIHYFLLPPIK